MAQNLYTYALIKSLYDKGEDYIDSFWPLVINSVKLAKPKLLLDIQAELQKHSSLNIPLHILRTILSRAKHKGFIKQEENTYVLSREGHKYLESFEEEGDVERRISGLIKNLHIFYISKSVSISEEEVSNILFSFVQSNLKQLIDYVNPAIDNSIIEISPEIERNTEELLLEYFVEAQTSKPAQYQVLKELVFGSIISSILYVPENTNLNEIKDKKLNECTIYLDSNIALCVLGLIQKERNEAAKELIDILKGLGATLKIFDFTVQQIRKLIRAYEINYDSLVPTVKVDSLHSAMQVAGWLPSDVQEYLLNLDDKFKELGVIVEYVEDVSVDSDKPYNDKFQNLKDYKTNNNAPIGDINHEPSIAGINHDLIAIDKIRKIRKRSFTSLETVNALFLTSDNKLTWFDFMEMGHRDAGTIAEVILDRILMNLVWLKNPNLDLPLKSIIASHSRELFVKRNVWEKFYQVLKNLEKENKINDKQISSLFYHNDMEKTLKEFNHQSLDRINEDFVLRQIATIDQNIDTKIEEEKDKIRVEFIEKLKESEEDKTKIAEEAMLKIEERLYHSRNKVTVLTKKVVNYIVTPLLFLLWAGIILLIYWLVAIKKIIGFDAFLVVIAIMGVSVIGLGKGYLLTRKFLIEKLSEKISALVMRLINI